MAIGTKRKKGDDRDMDLGTKPIDGVPRARVLDEHGKEIMQGWYVFHESRMCAIGDSLRESDVQHVVVVDSFADWNMPRSMQPYVITPPCTIEVVEE